MQRLNVRHTAYRIGRGILGFALGVLLGVQICAPQAFAADDPVNYDDPNLAHESSFVGDDVEESGKLVAPELQNVVNVLVENSNSGDRRKASNTAR
ncbi:MAG: hypothetical protein V4692_07470 [Bdellovibrionota bacterium]